MTTTRVPTRVREFEEWINASMAEAGAIVPELLVLPGPLLLRELRTRPELRTPGLLRRLLAAARDCISRKCR